MLADAPPAPQATRPSPDTPMPPNRPARPLPIYIVSDSTGNTAENVVRAALQQFRDYLVHIQTYPNVRDEKQLRAIIRLAGKERALVVFTLVQPENQRTIYDAATTHGVQLVDLIGALLGKLADYLALPPEGVPGHGVLGDEYFRRIEAVEFTVKHDDGAEPRHLHKADLVLVGVSRTSKTPLSTFLAHRGWKVANVPIVLGIEPPRELSEVDQDRVYALTIEAHDLHEIRMARLRNLGMSTRGPYGQMEHIALELEYARDLFRRNPAWPVIDVTHKAVEETAAQILQVHNERLARRARAKKPASE